MKKHEVLYLILCILPAFAGGCSNGYMVVQGPANLTLASTPFTPGVSITIGEKGRAWIGPDYDAFYMDEPEEEQETPAGTEDLPQAEPAAEAPPTPTDPGDNNGDTPDGT